MRFIARSRRRSYSAARTARSYARSATRRCVPDRQRERPVFPEDAPPVISGFQRRRARAGGGAARRARASVSPRLPGWTRRAPFEIVRSVSARVRGGVVAANARGTRDASDGCERRFFSSLRVRVIPRRADADADLRPPPPAQVHSANQLSRRHVRSWLCDGCYASSATVRPRFVARASFPPVASGFITRRLGDPRCICSFFSSPRASRVSARLDRRRDLVASPSDDLT